MCPHQVPAIDLIKFNLCKHRLCMYRTCVLQRSPESKKTPKYNSLVWGKLLPSIHSVTSGLWCFLDNTIASDFTAEIVSPTISTKKPWEPSVSFVPKHEQSPLSCAQHIPPHHPHIEGFVIQPGWIYLHLSQEMDSAPIPVVNLCIQCAYLWTLDHKQFWRPSWIQAPFYLLKASYVFFHIKI
jgi:hypothetical protein